jgi:hypothetical protein
MNNIPHEVLQQGGFVGPRFTGVFLFQNVFWRVSIPLVFGTVRVPALDALEMMPTQVKQLLSSRRNDMREYLKLWADCFDYDSGFQFVRPTLIQGSFLEDMIDSVERELTSAVSDLCQQRPNSKAIHSSRDTAEKALKGYLCHHANLTADEAKRRFGHSIEKLLKEISVLTPHSPLLTVGNQLGVFAPYGDRYKSTVYNRSALWRAYRLAQFTAAEVQRSISGRNLLSAVLRDPIFHDD